MNAISIERINSLGRINRDTWNNDFALTVHLRYDNLKVVEESGINDIRNIYLRYFNGREIGRSNLYLVNTDFSTMDSNLKNVIGPIKKWYPDFMKMKTLECGSFTGISEGTVVNTEECYPDVIRLLAKEMDAIAKEEDADIELVRDIPLSRYELYKEILSEYGFYPTPGFPDTEIGIAWDSIDHYFEDLNKNARIKTKKIMRNLEEKFGIEYEMTQDYGNMVTQMVELWKNVNKSAQDYQRERLDENYFIKSYQYLKNSSEVLLLKKDGRIVAFFFSLFDDENYYVENFGVDYGIPEYRNMNLYRAGLLLSIERAITLRKKHFYLGITNYSPKMLMGANVIPLVYFIKSSKEKGYSKALAKLMYDDLRQPDTKQHKPFKNMETNTVDYPMYLLNVKTDQYELKNDDIFLKASKYHRINTLKLAKVYNLYPVFKTAQESSIKMKDLDRVVLLGTNSYLGAATFPEVKEAAKLAIDKYGTGCSGSPLLNGTLDLHKELEEELAKFMNREAVMLCSTGYQTNLAGVSALSETGDVLILDERSHRSLFDAAKLSGANYFIFKHNDVGHLEFLLSKLKDKKKLIVSDSVFSMEGVIADLVEICRLARKYNARTFIDEAHAVGVFGENGRGVCESLGLGEEVDLVMGTFSKSFASIGGFIAGKRDVIDFIKHTASPHVFSASLPPSAVATVLAVLKIIKERPELRRGILEKAKYMADSLKEMGYNTSFKGTQIVPIVFGNETLVMAAYKRFMEKGVYVNPVLQPAVPEKDSGFRTSYIATHKKEDLEYALSVFKDHKDDFAGIGPNPEADGNREYTDDGEISRHAS